MEGQRAGRRGEVQDPYVDTSRAVFTHLNPHCHHRLPITHHTRSNAVAEVGESYCRSEWYLSVGARPIV